ncbi:MAG TPA: helical backbone metal receptor [Ohtaekwangia sp.]|uniref:ABC transporter substrate-binding protein n=1 Tax=Ohtaekwangia sp. TaxID=2066019 RepID=UPI002F957EA6
MLRTFTDQMGHRLSITFPPKRIVSLVPSQTELLSTLGLESEVVGITKFCVHPVEWLQHKTIIGGTKNFRFDVIEALQPDLIIGNKEENYEEGIRLLQEKYPVWMSDIVSMNDAMDMIQGIGEITGKAAEASHILQSIQQSFEILKSFSGQSILYFIWRNPWMVAGNGTFIHEMLERLTLRNIAPSPRYPELTDENIRQLKPDYIFLSSEPYPFQEKHIAELKQLSPSSEIILVDGEMFSWYGSRLALAPHYFNSLNTLLR